MVGQFHDRSEEWRRICFRPCGNWVSLLFICPHYPTNDMCQLLARYHPRSCHPRLRHATHRRELRHLPLPHPSSSNATLLLAHTFLCSIIPRSGSSGLLPRTPLPSRGSRHNKTPTTPPARRYDRFRCSFRWKWRLCPAVCCRCCRFGYVTLRASTDHTCHACLFCFPVDDWDAEYFAEWRQVKCTRES